MSNPTPAERKHGRKNTDPHAEAHAAMTLWSDEYCRQNGGSIDFWDGLSSGRKTYCRELVARIKELPSEKRADAVVQSLAAQEKK
jgi:hypothetical protein